MIRVLSQRSFERAVTTLCERDERLARIVAQWGPPPFWTHPIGFPGITLAILAQQVSLESAQAAFRKLERTIHTVTPAAFLTLDAAALRAVGFSRQKASYVRGIALNIDAGDIDFDSLRRLSDDAVRARLQQLRGVGRWTADTYLLFALRRADVWPRGDLALEIAVAELAGAPARLAEDAVDRIVRAWAPLRAVAARILWCHYLKQRGR